jgi:hypothetical protein
MAGPDKKADDTLRENSLVTQLLAQGAESAMTLRGFIGPSSRDGYVRLYPKLTNMAESVEIARADILHSLEAPKSKHGAVILWVKREAQVFTHRVNTAESVSPAPRNLVDVRKGRLRMQMRVPQTEDICFSVCMDCLSWCSCSICSTLPERRG